MRAELHHDGKLVIKADNSVEAYALQQWERQRKNKRAELIIDYEGEWMGWEGLKTFNDVFKQLGVTALEFKKWADEKRAKGEKIEPEGAENIARVAGTPALTSIIDRDAG